MSQFFTETDPHVSIKDRILNNLNQYEGCPNEDTTIYGVNAILCFFDYVQPIWPESYYYKVLEILSRIRQTWGNLENMKTHLDLLEFCYRNPKTKNMN